MKIQILQCAKDTYWYANDIGKIFEATKGISSGASGYRVERTHNVTAFVEAHDCIELTEEGLPVISKDKSKPTWARVWFDSTERYRRILLDVLSDGSCIAVNDQSEENYLAGRFYHTTHFPHYTLDYNAAPLNTHAFKDAAEFIRWLKLSKRTDMRFIDKGHNNTLFSISSIGGSGVYGVHPDRVAIFSKSFDYLYKNCVWFDTEEPIAIKEDMWK